MNWIVKAALTNSSLTAFYIIGIALFINYGSETKLDREFTILIPITMLLLFVFSAALTGFLIFGRSAMLYVDGKKIEALRLLMYTILFLGAYTLGAIILLFTLA